MNTPTQRWKAKALHIAPPALPLVTAMDDLRALIEAVNLTEDDIRKAMTARRDGKSRVVQEWTNRKAAALRAKLEGE
jgi:hypothetical protein